MIDGTMKVSENTGSTVNYGKSVGVFEGQPVMVNPSKEELGILLNTTLEQEYEYGGETPEGFRKMTVSMWSIDKDSKKPYNTRFYLIEKERESMNNPGSFQYINTAGACTWSKDIESLPVWFTTDREYRKALVGEEELHEFMRSWLNKLDFKDPATTVLLDTKKMFGGDMTELRSAISRFKDESLCELACVREVMKDGEVKYYQAVYNKKFLPGPFIKSFREGKTIKSKLYENFVSQISNPQYGLKDKYSLEYIHPWEPGAETVSKPAILNKDEY